MPGAIGAGVEIAATRSWRASVPTAAEGDLRRFGEDANDTVLHDRKDSMAAPTDGVCRIRGLNRLPSGLEVSRLARSCTDWHHLLEICALFRTLILDEDGIYDPGSGVESARQIASIELLDDTTLTCFTPNPIVAGG